MPAKLVLDILPGAVNTGLLRCGKAAVLFDCCDSVTPARLAELGVHQVDWIFCTQHRRPNTAGAYAFLHDGTRLACPEKERALFENPAAYWTDWRNRWYLITFQPGPQVPARPLQPARGVVDGEVIDWHGARIRVLETPGATDGSVSYLVEWAGRSVCFCGDALYSPGQVWDLYSLQKGWKTWDYHGFMGNWRHLRPSLEKLAACGAAELIPSHGEPMPDPATACGETVAALDALWRNYVYVSSMHHYFPEAIRELAAGLPSMPRTEVRENPPFIRYVGETSFAMVSESGAAFLVDAASATIAARLGEWLRQGDITSVDGAWVTHYHYDHVDGLAAVHQAFGCPVLADEHMAEILTHPRRFVLPCISPSVVPAVRATHHGESWQWHEFTLTAYHFPGQSLYHGALFVEGRGKRILFAGDSLSPAGIDDYCSGNRNLLGFGKGFDYCLDLLWELRPDLIYNQHQREPFHFSHADISTIKRYLSDRYYMMRLLLPWDEPNFGLDEHWVRAYPYEQDVLAGGTLGVEVQFTNHAMQLVAAEAQLVVPPEWHGADVSRMVRVRLQAGSEGAARVFVRVPPRAPRGEYLLPIRVTWNGRYLGPCRQCLVCVL